MQNQISHSIKNWNIIFFSICALANPCLFILYYILYVIFILIFNVTYDFLPYLNIPFSLIGYYLFIKWQFSVLQKYNKFDWNLFLKKKFNFFYILPHFIFLVIAAPMYYATVTYMQEPNVQKTGIGIILGFFLIVLIFACVTSIILEFVQYLLFRKAGENPNKIEEVKSIFPEAKSTSKKTPNHFLRICITLFLIILLEWFDFKFMKLLLTGDHSSFNITLYYLVSFLPYLLWCLLLFFCGQFIIALMFRKNDR